jgi:Rieske Fe-S protein
MKDRACSCRGGEASRREVVAGGLGLGLAGGLPGLAGAQDAAALRPRAGDYLIRQSDAGAKPLTPADIPLHVEQVFAWAVDPADSTIRKASRLNGVILVRYEPSELAEETRGRAADGIVAYTQICTHNGCDVASWVAAERVVMCACHFTKYDPRDACKVLEGPAPRPLPALPIKVEDGRLVVAKAYTDRVGFETA